MQDKASVDITPTKSTEISRQDAISNTIRTLNQVIRAGGDWLVHHPPTIHPERHLADAVNNSEVAVTYLTSTKAQQGRIIRHFENAGLSVAHVTSDKDLCGSYSGDLGEDYAERVRAICADQGTSLGELHSAGDLRCQPGCPFRSRSKYDEYDVLVGHPTIAYMDETRADRTIFVDGLTGDEFLTPIRDPAKQLTPYIQDETGLSGYNEFIGRRTDPGNSPTLSDYAHNSIVADAIDGERAVEAGGHVLAPLVTFSLLFTVGLNNGWETTYHHQHHPSEYRPPTNQYQGPVDRWGISGLDYDRHRVVRRPGQSPEDDTIYVLRLPDFSPADGIIGLDVAPTKWMWDACYGRDFDLSRVYNADQIRRFLRQTMGITVVQTASTYKPYDGDGVTPKRDSSITLWTGAEFGKRPVLVSTKNALTNQYPAKEPDLLNSDVMTHRRYRSADGLIQQDKPIVLAHGAPRPRNEVFQMWGAFGGESVPAESDDNNSFGAIGDKIRRQLMHSRVGRAVTRFGANGEEATIVLNTTACPNWLWSPDDCTADPTQILPPDAFAKRKVARYLRQRGQNGDTATIHGIIEGTSVTESAAREAANLFIGQNWVTEHDFGGYRNHYEWEP